MSAAQASDVAAVVVSDHARVRFAERTGTRRTPVSLTLDVQDAFRDGRWSRKRPAWIARRRTPRAVAGSVYAWDSARRVVFVLHEGVDAFVLVTVIVRASTPRYPMGQDRQRDLFNQRRGQEA